MCYNSWGRKESEMTERLNYSELKATLPLGWFGKIYQEGKLLLSFSTLISSSVQFSLSRVCLFATP